MLGGEGAAAWEEERAPEEGEEVVGGLGRRAPLCYLPLETKQDIWRGLIDAESLEGAAMGIAKSRNIVLLQGKVREPLVL